MSVNVLCFAHNDTVSYLSPLVDTCCHIFSECARRYLPYLQQSQLSQVPLLPEINPQSLNDRLSTLRPHTLRETHTASLSQSLFPHSLFLCIAIPLLFPCWLRLVNFPSFKLQRKLSSCHAYKCLFSNLSPNIFPHQLFFLITLTSRKQINEC